VTIQKKSLISKLNTTKKAIVASTPATAVSSNEVRTNMTRGSYRAAAGSPRNAARSARVSERQIKLRK